MAARAELTVVVVRHAEKASGADDPVLSEAGTRRADELARVLAHENVVALIASEYQRTQLTLAPLAGMFGLDVLTVPARESVEHLSADRLLSGHPAGVVVIASHSNLVPPIVRKLSGREVPDMDEYTYDDLYLVVLGENREPEVVRLQYGEPSGD